jgi:hypothetical protein
MLAPSGPAPHLGATSRTTVGEGTLNASAPGILSVVAPGVVVSARGFVRAPKDHCNKPCEDGYDDTAILRSRRSSIETENIAEHIARV